MATSRGDDLVTNEVKSDDARQLRFIKMASNRIANTLMQGRHFIALREYRMIQRSCCPSPFRGVFNDENDFVH